MWGATYSPQKEIYRQQIHCERVANLNQQTAIDALALIGEPEAALQGLEPYERKEVDVCLYAVKRALIWQLRKAAERGVPVGKSGTCGVYLSQQTHGMPKVVLRRPLTPDDLAANPDRDLRGVRWICKTNDFLIVKIYTLELREGALAAPDPEIIFVTPDSNLVSPKQP
jgi:hypothetical protein